MTTELTKKEIESELQSIGESVQIHLNMHYKQWKSGLPFKVVFNKYSTKCKKLGHDPTTLANELERKGFIKLAISPSGKRYVFSTDSKLDLDSMIQLVLDDEARIEAEKDAKRLRA